VDAFLRRVVEQRNREQMSLYGDSLGARVALARVDAERMEQLSRATAPMKCLLCDNRTKREDLFVCTRCGGRKRQDRLIRRGLVPELHAKAILRRAKGPQPPLPSRNDDPPPALVAGAVGAPDVDR
jgi:hypothetical protein